MLMQTGIMIDQTAQLHILIRTFISSLQILLNPILYRPGLTVPICKAILSFAVHLLKAYLLLNRLLNVPAWNIVINFISVISLQKHAYSNILKILPPNNKNFQIKILIFFIYLLKI